MSDEQAPSRVYSEDAEKKGMYLLLLLISDPPVSVILRAIEEFREAVEGEVSV